MKRTLSPKFWCALTLFSLIGQVAWVVENMYLNVFIYKMFRATAADISAMVAASAVAATLTTVLIGALSDKVGKRKLFICGGYILWGISIFAFVFIRMDLLEPLVPATLSAAAVGSSLVIVLDCVMTFFGSSANDAAFNAWLTDSTDSSNRGAAEGINAMMPLVAILVVFGGFMAFDLDAPSSWVTIFTVIGVVVTLVGVLGIFIIEDAPLTPSATGYWRGVVHGFLPSTLRQNVGLYVTLLCFVLFNISIQIFMPYLIIYYEVSLGMTDYVFVMAPAILLASVVTALWGKVYDKKGFSLSVWVSLAWLMAGYVVLFFCRTTLPVFVGSLLMMCGYLSGMAVFGAKIRDLTPVGQAGKFQGVRIFSQVLLPGLIGPYIGKTVLKNAATITNSDGTTSFVPNEGIFLAALVAAAVLALVLLLAGGRRPPRTCRLKTPFEPAPAGAWEEYPRPQLRRASYLSLNGPWSLSVRRGAAVTPLGEVTVPYPPESALSGIGRPLAAKEQYVYTRAFTLPEGFCVGRVLLHFGAVDQVATVAVNGAPAGSHEGGYLPFTLDITPHLRPGENTLTVTVSDPLDTDLPYGKQRKKRGGMWYTPVSGIWQSVWLESVPREYIQTLRITPTTTSVTVDTVGGTPEKTLTLRTPLGEQTYTYTGDSITITPDSPVLWTPENPHLYPFTLTAGEDTVESYFALRTLSVGQSGGRPCLLLNGAPYFFHGLLDQGYFSDGIYTPATPEGYRYDILTMKKLGFNMLRKHIKIEPDLFYYYCDTYGMVVFQDMVNAGRYSFLLDTALPTIGLKRGVSHPPSRRRRACFEQAARETVAHLYNHPCVCYYTIFNEGWGQYDADRLYVALKAEDPTRVWDATSGWFAQTQSDVVSEHIYFRPLSLPVGATRPVVLSEFGGYSCKIPDHAFNLDKTYGYKTCADPAAFGADLEALYREQVLPAIAASGLCATVLTQVSDVEDETNGLVTYDRQVVKVDPARMQALSADLHAAFAAAFPT